MGVPTLISWICKTSIVKNITSRFCRRRNVRWRKNYVRSRRRNVRRRKNYVRYFRRIRDELAECEGERKRVSVLSFHSALSDYLLIANLSRVLFSVIICFVFTRVHCTNIYVVICDSCDIPIDKGRKQSDKYGYASSRWRHLHDDRGRDGGERRRRSTMTSNRPCLRFCRRVRGGSGNRGRCQGGKYSVRCLFDYLERGDVRE